MKEPFKTLEIEGVKINLYEWYGGSERVDCEIIDAPDDLEIRTLILCLLPLKCKELGKLKQSHKWLYSRGNL